MGFEAWHVVELRSTKAAPAPKSRAGFVKCHRSPAEILDELCPPCCKFGLDFNQWRWTSTWKETSELFILDLNKKSHSRSFARHNWKDKLQEVHKYSWEKWQVVRDEPKFKLPDGFGEQTPGEISEEIYDALKASIDGLPEPKKYR